MNPFARLAARADTGEPKRMQYWLSTSLKRFYPRSPAMNCPTLALEAARSERLSFQALFRTDGEERTVSATVNAPAGVEVLVRRVGYVPMPHLNTQVPPAEIEGLEYLPGYVPDPLLPETVIHAGPYETHAFWITLRVDTDTSPGPREVHVTLSAEGAEPVTLSATLTVHPGVLPKRRDFPVTHWFYADALMDRYGVEPFEEAFWRILDPYLANVAAHGQDTIYVPVFTPPLDGVKRPTQLLHVRREGDRYVFGWTRWSAGSRRRRRRGCRASSGRTCSPSGGCSTPCASTRATAVTSASSGRPTPGRPPTPTAPSWGSSCRRWSGSCK